MHRTQLIYILDPMCSWCWGFSPVMQQVLEHAQGVNIPVTIKVGGLRSGAQAVLDDSKRAAILGHWRRVADTTGQPFEFSNALPSRFLYDTEPACRALVVARELNASLLFDFLERMQRAFYQDTRDITQPDILSDLAGQAGYSQTAFSAALNGTEARAATKEEFTWVGNLSVGGFPTLLGQHQDEYTLITNGYQPYTTLEPLLSRWTSVHAGT